MTLGKEIALPVDDAAPPDGNEADDRFAVTLLTGFLGAGKTTCLNAFLKGPDAVGCAVLVNEFGAVDVDGGVLSEVLAEGSALVRLPNGCVCCAVQDDLAEALLALAKRGGLKRCIIETTGLADAGAILRGLHHDPRLRAVARVDLVLTVCAADRIAEQIDRFAEPARQIGIADRILLSKTDLAGPIRSAEARSRIAALTPLAQIVEATDDVVREGALMPQAEARMTPPAANTISSHSHSHSHGVTSFSISLPSVLDADAFRDTMSFLIMRHAENLLRLKGVIRFKGVDTPQLVNLVHDVWNATPVATLPAQPGFVIIGQNLPETRIRDDIQRCQYSPAAADT